MNGMTINIILGHLLLLTGFLLAALVVTHVLTQPRSPASMIAWLVVLVLFPYIGVPLYLAIGGRKMKKFVSRKDRISLSRDATIHEQKASRIDRLLRNYDLPGATVGNSIKLCRTGVDGYRGMVDLIENSRESIFLATYLIREDEVGQDILKRLTGKAEQGIKVRLLMDWFGSLRFSKRFLQPLTRAGGRTAFFLPLLRRPFQSRTNLRNHRKILVVDEQRAMAGGTNIGMEYIGPLPRMDMWRDLSFIIEGPGVRNFAEIFQSDWLYASGEQLELNPDRLKAATPVVDEGVVQVVPSGPDVYGDPLYDAILTAIFAAQRRVWVVTPYFVPDEALTKALIIAAHRRIDVRILVPEKSNHFLADLARGVPFRQVLAGGGRILLFTPGMVHAKAILIDDEIAMIGSANMDMRSLFLDHEVMTFLYSPGEIKDLEDWMKHLARDAVTASSKVTYIRELAEGVVRMLAPLL